MNISDAKRVLETALICAQAPVPLRDLLLLFDGQVESQDVVSMLQELEQDWSGKGVELVSVASGWRFQSRPEMRVFLDRLHPEKPPRYSRAVMETLAIIAYRQPVTRGDIEEIRGVTVATQIVKQLEDRGWIETIGYRESPGRPALYATTRLFLDDLGLASLEQLPEVSGVGESGDAAEALAVAAGGPSKSQETSYADLPIFQAAAQQDPGISVADAPDLNLPGSADRPHPLSSEPTEAKPHEFERP